MGKWLYGCDICRLVCPYNKELKAIEVETEEMYPSLESIDELSNRTFRERFKERGFLWRGARTIKRNAKIARENSR